MTVGDLELMKLHIDALYTHDARGRLVNVNEPGDKPAPRVFLGRTSAGHVLRTRADVPDALVADLVRLVETEPQHAPLAQRPHCGDAIEALLSNRAPIERVWTGPAYCVDASSLAKPVNTVRVTAQDTQLLRTFPDWRDEVRFREPFMVAVEAGRAVALCCSVRITAAAHAAGVETLPDARRRGYAAQVVVAWAKAVASLGALPLYSTSTDNVASQGVARRLGMHRIGVDFHVT
jgi:RimJ/RimL family protein N-acetyltransferase